VTGWAAEQRPPTSAHDHRSAPLRVGRVDVRLVLSLGALVVLVAALVPPLSSAARRVEAYEALQFALMGIGVPVLVVLGAPWRLLGLAARPTGAADAEGVAIVERPRIADRVAAGRRRHPEPIRTIAFLLLDLAVVVLWRIPVTVDALSRHGWLSLLEAVSLGAAGIGLWLELVESPPLAPRLPRPKRIAVAAVAMWTFWVTAYVVGLSHASVYRSYPHVAGRDLSVAADQELTTGVLWLASLCVFIPVIFANLVLWLRSDEDPDDALYRLVRDRRHSAGG
jgi:cytochrome c oxidase assembly factor CtaG